MLLSSPQLFEESYLNKQFDFWLKRIPTLPPPPRQGSNQEKKQWINDAQDEAEQIWQQNFKANKSANPKGYFRLCFNTDSGKTYRRGFEVSHKSKSLWDLDDDTQWLDSAKFEEDFKITHDCSFESDCDYIIWSYDIYEADSLKQFNQLVECWREWFITQQFDVGLVVKMPVEGIPK